MKEEWKDIVGYDNYQVSNTGRIRSKRRKITQFGHKKDYQRVFNGKIINPHAQNGGYLVVWLSKNGDVKAMTVHRLVAIAFFGERKGMVVNHKDGNKQNNCIDNLEWVTRGDNLKHDYHVLKHIHNSCKVICVDTNEVYQSIQEAAKKNNISPSSIGNMIRGLNKTAGGKIWRKI